MFVLALLSVALAAPAHHAPGGLLADDLASGRIDRGEALWLSYLAHFEPDALPERYASEKPQGWSCTTGLVQELRRDWELLSPERRARATRVLAPWKEDLLAPDVTPPAPPASGACWTEGANRYASEHFVIEWDAGFSQSQAEKFANALETSYTAEVEKGGWKEPQGMTGYALLVYVSNENYAGAYTTVGQCGNILMPYIVVGKGSFQAGTWYMDMAAHEFNHASQYAYGFGHQFWFWEATATYVQESVYPTHDEWTPYVDDGYARQPYISMHASSQQDQEIFWHMYGMAVWPFYLDTHVGGPELVLDMWGWSEDHGEQYDLWMDDVLEGLDHDFREVFKGYVANGTVMDFGDAGNFPEVRRAGAIDELPSDGQVDGPMEPESRGQAYVRIDTDTVTEDLPDLLLSFEGDADADFVALLVGTEDGAIVETAELPLVDGVGEVRLAALADFDQAWLAVSPMSKREDESWPFSWSADAVEAERKPLLGCGCASGAGGAPVGALLGLAALAVRRRRA